MFIGLKEIYGDKYDGFTNPIKYNSKYGGILSRELYINDNKLITFENEVVLQEGGYKYNMPISVEFKKGNLRDKLDLTLKPASFINVEIKKSIKYRPMNILKCLLDASSEMF